jgi:diketogulonate reductase-like aldo/keto reductase
MEKLLSTGIWTDSNTRTFAHFFDLGKVRSLGVSNFSIKNLDILLPKINIIPVINQVELHPCLPQERLLEYCAEKGIRLGNWRQFHPCADGT